MVIILGWWAVSPRCKPGTEQMSVGALNMHSMQVKCEVEADPADSVKFHWTYNNTRNVSPVSFSWFYVICDVESSVGNFKFQPHIPQSSKKASSRLNFIARWECRAKRKIVLISTSRLSVCPTGPEFPNKLAWPAQRCDIFTAEWLWHRHTCLLGDERYRPTVHSMSRSHLTGP